MRQLKLRMSKSDVESLIRKQAMDGFLLKHDLAGVPGFDGVHSLIFRFYEGKLARLSVRYDADTQWPDLKQLTRRFSDDFALPFEAWSFRGSDAMIMCDGFVLYVNSQDRTLNMFDTDAADAERKKNKPAEDPKHQTSNP